MIQRLFHLDFQNVDDRNAWFLCLEIFWAAVMGSAATFNSAYVLRLGATNVEVSLLTSIPALLAVLVSIPAGWFLEQRCRRKPWVLGALGIYRAGYILMILAPWLPASFPRGGLVVVLLITMSLPVNFFNVGFFPLLADVIPEERRASIFAARNIIYNITASILTFGLGLWLSRSPFPGNYQSMFLFGFIGSVVGMYFLIKIQVPDSIAVAPTRFSVKVQLKAMRSALIGQPLFTRFTLNTVLHGIGIWAATPLYILYFIRDLNASDAWIGLQATVASVATIAGFAFWRWFIARKGEPRTLRYTIITLGLYPLLVGLTHSLTAVLFVVALNGLLNPGVSLSHFNTLLKITPEESRPTFTALYMTVVNVGAFICPLIAVLIADKIGFAPTLVACGLLSIVGSSSFWWRPVVPPAWQQQAIR